MARNGRSIEELRAGIQRWRRTREKRSRMPAELWEDAVSLALEHGVYRISSTLGLNYENLKKRTLVVSEEERDTGVESGGFIELRGSQLLGWPKRAETVLELADGNGATLTVRLSSTTSRVPQKKSSFLAAARPELRLVTKKWRNSSLMKEVHIFMEVEPLGGKRNLKITQSRTQIDWAHFIREMLEKRYPEAEKVVLVMDNLNTHSPASLYQAFPPEEARHLAERLEIHYTPKHGSWLDIAEIELSVLKRQCLAGRIDNIDKMRAEVSAWNSDRNNRQTKVDWQFTTSNARIKLKRLYPKL